MVLRLCGFVLQKFIISVCLRCLHLLLQMLKTEKDKEEMKHEEELREVVEKHAKELQDLGLSLTAR